MMIILCGRNGSGKTTIAKKLIEEHGYRKFPSVTTRTERPSDLRDEYEYISSQEFVQRQKRGLFAWQVIHAGESYGTERERLISAFLQKEARWVDILVPLATDMHAACATQAGVENYGRNQSVFYFYLWVVSEQVLYQRLIARGETPGSARLKLHASRDFDHEVRKINQREARFSIIENEHANVGKAVEEIFSVVNHWGT